ncbi:hypothetical protein TGS27_2797 [Geobacillus stearothermophilus]|nr:hypothetical protein TGS27_2797 [Geobacillus stearothermophilus]
MLFGEIFRYVRLHSVPPIFLMRYGFTRFVDFKRQLLLGHPCFLPRSFHRVGRSTAFHPPCSPFYHHP